MPEIRLTGGVLLWVRSRFVCAYVSFFTTDITVSACRFGPPVAAEGIELEAADGTKTKVTPKNVKAQVYMDINIKVRPRAT